MPKFINTLDIIIPAAGATIPIDLTELVDNYNLIPENGGIGLTNNFELSPSGTPSESMVLIFNYNGNVTYDGGIVSIFGTVLSAAEATTKYTVICNYINNTWVVTLLYGSLSYINGVNITPETITGAQIAANTISVGNLQNAIARGYIFRTGASGVWEKINAVIGGNFLMGNNTDLVSQALSGAISVANNGVVTINSNYITPSMLAYTPSEYFQDELVITSAQLLALNGIPQTIVASPGAGYHIEVISATASITFVSAAYATNTTLQLINTGADIAQLQDTAILVSSVNKKTKFKDVTSATAGQTQIISNTALLVKVATANPISGDSDIKVVVTYKIIQD